MSGDATAAAVTAIAGKIGVQLTDEQASTITEQAAVVLRDLILGALEKKVKADGDAAVAGITTLEEAEQSANKR